MSAQRHLWPQAKLTNLSHAMMRMDRDKHASWQHFNPLSGVWPSRVEYSMLGQCMMFKFFFFFFLFTDQREGIRIIVIIIIIRRIG